MTNAVACLRRARASATALVALAAVLAAAALAPGCDRVVNLTPFYDALPIPDALFDAGFRLDTGSRDGSIIPDSGNPSLDGGDGDALPDDDAARGDGSATPDGNIVRIPR
jgi:hypothetical protein